MKLFLIFFLSAFANFTEMESNDLYQYNKTIKKKDISLSKDQRKLGGHKKTKRKKKGKVGKWIDKIMGEDQEIIEILKRQEKNLIMRISNDKIMALTRVSGILLNSVIAMNVKPSKFVVRIDSDKNEIEGGEIRCIGHGFEKRVLAHCDLLVVDEKEFAIDVDIWGIDGAEGIPADYYYSGEEKAFISSSFAAFLQGVLDASKERIMTPFGESNKDNAKNKITNGLMSIASNMRSKIAKSGDQKLTMAFINSGKSVVVFFNKTLRLKEESE